MHDGKCLTATLEDTTIVLTAPLISMAGIFTGVCMFGSNFLLGKITGRS